MNVKKYFTEKFYVIAIAIFCCILWGSAFPVLKISYIELNMSPSNLNAKIVFAGMRFLLASILLFIFVSLFIKKSIAIKKKQILLLLSLGLLQTTLQYSLFYIGLANTTGTKSAILTSTGSFFVVILAHFIYSDDKMNIRKTIGIITGFTGIILVNWGKGGFSLDFSFMGEGLLIISAFISAFGTIMAKKLSKDIHPFLVTAWQMLLGSILLISFGLPQLEPNAITFTTKGWLLLLYSSFLSASAFSLWYSLLKYNKAGEISLYKFMIPVSGSILSTIFIPGENFSLYILFALIFVVFGIVAINYTPKVHSKNK